MLPFDEALARVLALGARAPSVERVALDAAEGRVLAEDLAAPFDLPGFDYSAMDGYAVVAAELAAADLTLPVRGESRTGALPGPLAGGTTMRIFTGAALPEGADAVVKQEDVVRNSDLATFAKAARVGQNVRRRGDDLRQGEVALARGARLRPAHLSLAASLDRDAVLVATRPVVAVLATGDELRPPGSPQAPGTIPESNTIAIRAMARRAGAAAEARGYVPDDRAATERAFAEAIASSDVLVTIGGVSVGDHDLVRPALEAVGVRLDLFRVAIKPGKPFAVGVAPRAGGGDALVVCLPGNPASAIVTFGLFGVPLLRALQGDARPLPPRLRARMTRAHAHEPGRLELARATIAHEAGGARVSTFDNQASGASTTMAHADALAMIPAEVANVEAGTEVEVLLLADLGA